MNEAQEGLGGLDARQTEEKHLRVGGKERQNGEKSQTTRRLKKRDSTTQGGKNR